MARRFAFYLRALRAELRRLDERRALEERFPTTRFEDGVKVISPHLLEMGAGVNIQRNSLIHCGGLRWSQGRGAIRIGDKSTVSHNCILWGAGEIELGRNVHLAPGTFVTSVQSEFEIDPDHPDATHLFRPVEIRDEVVVFSCSLVAPGVTIGEWSVISGMSFVTQDVPPMEMWGGVPARKLRTLDPSTRKSISPG